ncbi:MAG: hypothetical protein AB7O87_08550, partial [Candidatus Nitrosocosmicus sp.]
WYEGGNWTRYQIAPNGSASPNGGIAAVSRIPNSMEVWWIGANIVLGNNGWVEGSFWYEGGNWTRYQIAPNVFASPNGGIAAVSRIPNSMEVWWIGANGSIYDGFYYDPISLDSKIFDAGHVTTDYAVGGPMKVVITKNGEYTFSGHWHNSGADNYDLDLGMVIVTPSGIAYTFETKGTTKGTFSSGSRDFNWTLTGQNPNLKNNWNQILQSSFRTYANVDSALEDTISEFANTVAKEILKEGAKTIIAIITA